MKKLKYSIVQLWYQLTTPILEWIEWQDAKYWAEDYYPAWLLIATNARTKETRLLYRRKIIAAYRGDDDNGENWTD